MYRLGHMVDNEWVAHSHPPLFDAADRLTAGVPGSDPAVIGNLADCLAPPYFLLYVLHSPRGEAPPGRYQSPALSAAELRGFLDRFGPFLRSDGRYDLWVHSPADNATLVWDRHDLLYGYGPVARYADGLRALGFAVGTPAIPSPHEHCCRSEFDTMAAELIAAFDWTATPLQPEDEQ